MEAPHFSSHVQIFSATCGFKRLHGFESRTLLKRRLWEGPFLHAIGEMHTMNAKRHEVLIREFYGHSESHRMPALKQNGQLLQY